MKRVVGAVLQPYFIVLYTVDNGPQNDSMIEYSTVYDRLHTAKYGRNTAPTKRVRYSLKESFTTVLMYNLRISGLS
jgi:hypothetical protein